MKMLTSVSAETINTLSPDAGVVMLDVSIDDVDTVEELMTLIDAPRSDPEKWVGVTKGGVKVNDFPVRDPGQQVDEKTAVLTVNGVPVDGRLTRHVMLH